MTSTAGAITKRTSRVVATKKPEIQPPRSVAAGSSGRSTAVEEHCVASGSATEMADVPSGTMIPPSRPGSSNRSSRDPDDEEDDATAIGHRRKAIIIDEATTPLESAQPCQPHLQNRNDVTEFTIPEEVWDSHITSSRISRKKAEDITWKHEDYAKVTPKTQKARRYWVTSISILTGRKPKLYFMNIPPTRRVYPLPQHPLDASSELLRVSNVILVSGMSEDERKEHNKKVQEIVKKSAALKARRLRTASSQRRAPRSNDGAAGQSGINGLSTSGASTKGKGKEVEKSKKRNRSSDDQITPPAVKRVKAPSKKQSSTPSLPTALELQTTMPPPANRSSSMSSSALSTSPAPLSASSSRTASRMSTPPTPTSPTPTRAVPTTPAPAPPAPTPIVVEPAQQRTTRVAQAGSAVTSPSDGDTAEVLQMKKAIVDKQIKSDELGLQLHLQLKKEAKAIVQS